MRLQLRVAKTEFSTASSDYEFTRKLCITVILLGLGFASLLGYSLISGIRSSLDNAIDLTHSISNGDLAKTIDIQGNDEISNLLWALSDMQSSLARVVGVFRNGAVRVSDSSNEIAQSNTDLSRRTEGQASALEETSSSMEQLGAQVRHNAEKARLANKHSIEASDVAIRGGDAVFSVIAIMKEINESSQRISDITAVIDGIAFQTNILALNAAVEAARAGEQGRGFAVVASEVRSLAGRSAAAAKEIKSLIGASVEKVGHGTNLVDIAGSTMREIVDSIASVTILMSEISSASREQAVGISQVSEAVSQIDQFTQQNAALVEESAAKANELNARAKEMVLAVASFNLAESLPGGRTDAEVQSSRNINPTLQLH